MSRYALGPHVFVCLSGEHFVLLDLRRDRYFAIDAAQGHGLAALVAGWPGQAAEGECPSEPAQHLLRTLLAQGIVVAKPDSEQIQRHQIGRPVSEIVSEDYEEKPRLALGTILAFVIASLTAAFAVRRWPFERLVRRVEQRASRRRVRAAPPDPARTRQLIQAFVYLRPFLFTARDRCLFESFALIEFLAWHGLYPRWVFGVQARPFAAHCWLQEDGSVLNDNVERVSAYTSIMVV